MLRIFVASIVFAVSVGREANAAEVRKGLFTVTLPVIAILNDNLYMGEAVAYIDRTGTIAVRSVVDPKNRMRRQRPIYEFEDRLGRHAMRLRRGSTALIQRLERI